MNNYSKFSIHEESRTELHDKLNLTGAEVSINFLPAGTSVPFVHSHKQNEEIYAILDGEGTFVVDGESITMKKGDWIRIAPLAKRQVFASSVNGIKYICIQAKENSLEQYTMTDAVLN